MVGLRTRSRRSTSSGWRHVLIWASVCVGPLFSIGLGGTTPVQAQTTLVCTQDLCRVLRSDGEVLSSCRRGGACGTRPQDGDRQPTPVTCPSPQEETVREHTDVASCWSRYDGRIVSCCWVGDTCDSDTDGERYSITGVSLDPNHAFGGLASGWAGVSDAAARNSLLVVATRSEPFLHLFDLADGQLVRTWGSAGDGPSEFRAVGSVALSDSNVYALDTSSNRLSVFDLDGRLARSVSVTSLGLPLPFADEVVWSNAGEVLLRTYEPMGSQRAVVALAPAGSVKTVVSYNVAPAMRLESPPGSPGLSVIPPFSPRPVWTPVDERVAYWPAGDAELRILGLDGTVSSMRPLPFDADHVVTTADREHWFRSSIPVAAMGQRTRETVAFPDLHPLAVALEAGPTGDIWVLRTPTASGQVWDVVGPSGESSGRVELPAGWRLASVLHEWVVVVVADSMGAESVQVHSIERRSR